MRNLSAGFFLGGTAGPGSLQSGSTYRVPAEGAGEGRNRPAGLPELQTVSGIKGKSLPRVDFVLCPGKLLFSFSP